MYAYALAQWKAAQLAVQQDRPEEARAHLKMCLFLWPRSFAVHFLSARAARLTGDFDAAEAHLQRCLRLQHGASEAVQLEFLLMRVQRGETEEVAPALLDCVEKNHAESALILETLARSYMHHLRYHQASACLNRWLKEKPKSPKPYHWRGWIYERMNNSKAAFEDYRQALELDASLFPVRLRVAEMLLEDNNPVEALPHLERLRRDFPDRPEVAARLGQCRFLQGDWAKARPLLEEAEKQLPKDLPLLNHLAKLEVREGRPARAEELLQRALKVDPSETEARYTLVSALQLQGRSKEAAAELERYHKFKDLVDRTNQLLRAESDRPSNDAGRPAEIGALLFRMGREQLGIYWLHEALKRDPNHQDAHKELADHYERKGDRDNAAAHRRRLVEKRPHDKLTK